MPFGGNDWLALTQETTLEPDLPICDPHHHMWDRRPVRIPYQKYMLDELYADLNSGHNVVSTVFVEARAMYLPDGPEEMRPVGEVEFVQGMGAAGATGLYGPARAAAAIVGHANLNLGERVEPVLQALQAASPNRFEVSATLLPGTHTPKSRTLLFTRPGVSWPVTHLGPERGCSPAWGYR